MNRNQGTPHRTSDEYMMILTSLTDIHTVLSQFSTIAIVGLSPKKERPSNRVARYLLENDFAVIPVNPGHDKILGLKCYPDLKSIKEPVEIVNIFRKAADVPPIAQDAVEIGAAVIWMQQGIISEEGARTAKENDLYVIMDRCIKTEHINLV